MLPSQCPIRKLTIARSIRKLATNCAIEIARNIAALLPKMMSVTLAASVLGAVPCPAQQPAQQLTNGTLSMTVDGQNGSYRLGPIGGQSALQASVSALVNHTWLHPGDYPAHSVSELYLVGDGQAHFGHTFNGGRH